MKVENLGIVYRLSVEEVQKALEYWLTVVHDQGIFIEKVEPEFVKEYYQIGNFEQDYNEVFDGVKIVANYTKS